MNRLEEIYTTLSDPDGYTGSVSRLQKRTKLPLKVVKRFLEKQDGYTLNRTMKRKIMRNHILTSKVDQQWQCDLSDMIGLKGRRYCFVCIDCYSRYVFVIPIVNKLPNTIILAFQEIFDSTERKPEVVQSDKGGEFINRKVQNFLKSKNVKFVVATGEHKAAMVERVQRTLKDQMWRYLSTFPESKDYEAILPDLVHSYNNRYHSSIGKTPTEVVAGEVPRLKFAKRGKQTEKFNVGDHVRLLGSKQVFAKGFHPSWSEQIYQISEIDNTKARRMYKLIDLNGELIKGKWYNQEIQKVAQPVNFMIEKYIRSRIKNGRKQWFVKWAGYSDKFNSWTEPEP